MNYGLLQFYKKINRINIFNYHDDVKNLKIECIVTNNHEHKLWPMTIYISNINDSKDYIKCLEQAEKYKICNLAFYIKADENAVNVLVKTVFEWLKNKNNFRNIVFVTSTIEDKYIYDKELKS